MRRRRGKYNNRRTTVCGRTFDSKKEAQRYLTLLAMEERRDISHLKCQVPFNILINGHVICTYKADFTYYDKERNYIVEDVKGYRTDIYKLKKKLVEASYGVNIKEV